MLLPPLIILGGGTRKPAPGEGRCPLSMLMLECFEGDRLKPLQHLLGAVNSSNLDIRISQAPNCRYLATNSLPERVVTVAALAPSATILPTNSLPEHVPAKRAGACQARLQRTIWSCSPPLVLECERLRLSADLGGDAIPEDGDQNGDQLIEGPKSPC
jgi:hypothetical protein